MENNHNIISELESNKTDTICATPLHDNDLPYWLQEGNIEPEKTKVVIFLKKGETIGSGLMILMKKYNRLPTDKEIINYFQ